MYVSAHEINPFPYYYDWEERITQEKAFFYWIGSTIPVFLCIFVLYEKNIVSAFGIMPVFLNGRCEATHHWVYPSSTVNRR